MYACFIDFSKAYDCVPGALLWQVPDVRQVMQHIGMSTKFLLQGCAVNVCSGVLHGQY